MDPEQEQLAGAPDSNAAAAAAEEHNEQAEQHDDQTDEASQEVAEEEEEIEIGDKKFALPKSAAEKLKAERLMQADYTRKTQEVAETRKAIEAERELVKLQAQQHQQYLNEVAEVVSIDKQLAHLEKLDWSALIAEDPVQAMQLQRQQQALQSQRNAAAQAITQKQQQHALAEQQDIAKRAQEADAYLKREIPGWSDERSARLKAFAVEQGLPADQLAMAVVRTPALAKVLHKAELFDQLEKKQSTKPKAPAAPPAPVTRVGAARATAAKDPSKMSAAEWMEHRNKELRKR